MRLLISRSWVRAPHTARFGASLVAQTVENPPAMRETWVRSLGWKFPWKRAWQPTPVFLPGESPWTEEPGGLQRVQHDWVTKHSTNSTKESALHFKKLALATVAGKGGGMVRPGGRFWCPAKGRCAGLGWAGGRTCCRQKLGTWRRRLLQEGDSVQRECLQSLKFWKHPGRSRVCWNGFVSVCVYSFSLWKIAPSQCKLIESGSFVFSENHSIKETAGQRAQQDVSSRPSKSGSVRDPGFCVRPAASPRCAQPRVWTLAVSAVLVSSDCQVISVSCAQTRG